MIIVDTSIWIEFFKAKEPYFSELKQLIENREVIALELVFGELIQGCKNEREKNLIVEYWHCLNKYSSENMILEASILSYSKKFIDKGVGLIDAIIIFSSDKLNCQIWTLDKKLLSMISKQKIN